MSSVQVAVLSVPALLLAGGAASIHCVAMCGAVSARQAQAAPHLPPLQALALLHAGRVFGYALLGALAGAIGQALLRHLPDPSFGRTLQALAAVLLIVAGVRRLQTPTMPICCRSASPRPPSRSSVLMVLRGSAWAAVPCGLLYSVLLLAALSGTPADGALLTGAFALGGTPLLALVGWRSRRRWPHRHAGAWLIAIGVLSFATTVLIPSDPLRSWCATPTPVTRP